MRANRKVYSPEGYLNFRSDWFNSKSDFQNPGMYKQPTPKNLNRYGITIEQWRDHTGVTGSDTEIWLGRLGLFPQEIENYLAGKTFDWYKHNFRTGIIHDHTISFSGANDRVNYYMSVGYLNNEGLRHGDDYQAIRANLKLDGKVNKYLSIGANVNFQDRKSDGIAVDWNNQLANSPYSLPVDDEGDLVLYPMGYNGLNGGWNYEYEKQFRERESGATVLNSILTAKVTLPFNITYSFNFSPRYQFDHYRNFESSEHPEWKTSHNGYVRRYQTKRFEWNLNNIINWDYTLHNKHHFNVTLSQKAEEYRSWHDEIMARNFQPNDALEFHNTGNADSSQSSFSSSDTHSTADAMLARLFYSYDQRYMITASVRRYGYSAFGTSNPRATFPAIALAWLFTNEKFWNWPSMSMGKLRLSWGKNGNRSLSDIYTALSNLNVEWADGSAKTQGYIDPSTGALVEYQALIIDRLANPNL
ncbi:MAG: hypothetical protein LUD15_01600 [Bacteroides sp.]|nr:hypothetical protein [Bacteroides sp.]